MNAPTLKLPTTTHTYWRWVVVEGPPGSGKSSMVDLIAEDFESRGWEVLKTQEPWENGPYADVLMSRDKVLASDMLAFFDANRTAHLSEVVVPFLCGASAKSKRVVIQSKYYHCAVAHQGMCDISIMSSMLSLYRHYLPSEDFLILIDMSPEESGSVVFSQQIDRGVAAGRAAVMANTAVKAATGYTIVANSRELVGSRGYISVMYDADASSMYKQVPKNVLFRGL